MLTIARKCTTCETYSISKKEQQLPVLRDAQVKDAPALGQ